MKIICSNCSLPYPESGAIYNCPVCGCYFDYAEIEPYSEDKIDPAQPGIFRYRNFIGLPNESQSISLGEGNTPLIWSEVDGKRVGFKLEYLNPTGSYKDRGSAVLVNFLISRGITELVEDSSGNAGASLSAYSARAGMSVSLFIPEETSGPKYQQMLAHGAKVIKIPGPRSNATNALIECLQAGVAYASHAYLPFGLAGYATIAYELIEQLGGAPGAMIAPVGQGNLILSIGRAFQAMVRSEHITRMPQLIGVQAAACAPLWAIHEYGAAGLGWVSEGKTLAEGVKVLHPVRGDAVLKVIKESQGMMVAVREEDILPGRDRLAKLGFYVEPTSAIVWDGLKQIIATLPDPIVIILTGSGLKYVDMSISSV